MQEIEVYELYDVWYKPWWQTTYARISAACLALIALGILLWFILKWVRSRRSVPYWQQALQQCAQLRSSSNSLELPILYAQLTGLLKGYLQARYNESLNFLTDTELIDAVQKLPLSSVQKSNVKEILTYAVPAKFNSDQVELADPVIHIALLEQLIKETSAESNPVSKIA